MRQISTISCAAKILAPEKVDEKPKNKIQQIPILGTPDTT